MISALAKRRVSTDLVNQMLHILITLLVYRLYDRRVGKLKRDFREIPVLHKSERPQADADQANQTASGRKGALAAADDRDDF